MNTIIREINITCKQRIDVLIFSEENLHFDYRTYIILKKNNSIIKLNKKNTEDAERERERDREREGERDRAREF